MKTVVLHNVLSCRAFSTSQAPVPGSDPNLLLVVLIYYIGKIQDRIKIGKIYSAPHRNGKDRFHKLLSKCPPLRIFHN